MVPSEVSSTAFEGIASTIIVSESPSTSEITKSKEPAVSSEKVKELSSKVGSSLTGVTVKEMVAVLELDPSVAVRTSVPYELVSELVFSSEKKEILDSWETVSSVPAFNKIPSSVVKVKPEGMESTVIVTVPLEFEGEEIEKEPGESSLKVKD
jgi:hypothetical protein